MVALRAMEVETRNCFLPNPAQIRILNLLTACYSNKAIATALSLSLPTVEYHLTRLFIATGTQNRVELAVWWRDLLEMPLQRFLGVRRTANAS